MPTIPNIFQVDFVDASRMAAALLMRHEPLFDDDQRLQKTPGSPYHDTRSIFLRAPEGYSDGGAPTELWSADVAYEDTKALQSWPSARGVMRAIHDSHMRRANAEPVFGKAIIMSLKAGGYIDWHVDAGPYASTYNRFLLCLKPSPGAIMFAAGEWQKLEANTLTFFNSRALHSAINLGPCECIYLVVDVRIPDEAKQQPQPKDDEPRVRH